MNKLTVSPFPPASAALRRALVILAPHPDDDVLGCGRLIVAARRAGMRVVVVALTDGQASHPDSRRWPPATLGRLRRGEMRRGLARLGAGRVPLHFLGWRDGALAEDGSALRLRRLLHQIGAGDVAVTSPRDDHPDHQAAWALARAATKGGGSRLLAYEVWSRAASSQRRIAPAGCAKRWAIAAHRSQIAGYIADDPAGFRLDFGDLRRLLAGGETLQLRGASVAACRADRK
jgi:LmbE family N-acetylglucosaminyl deacetylase